MSSLQKHTHTHTFSVRRAVSSPAVDLSRGSAPTSPTFRGPETTVRNGWSQTGSLADVGKCEFVSQPGGSASAPIDPPNLKTLRCLLDPLGFGQLLPTAVGGLSPVIYYKRGLG